MINNATLETILTDADDFSVLVELYAADAEPPFDPADALFAYASTSITFATVAYERYVRSIGRIKRTISAESNSAQVEFSNLDGTFSDYELTTGFEGLIMVLRLISRERSTLANSLILFVGRCEQPDSGTRESLTVTANQIISGFDGEIPRRKFAYDDPNGLHASDPNFEGFRFMPQYGSTTYSVRQRRGGLLGLFGLKKTVTKTLQYSSFSDLDADKYVPVTFGRCQLMLTHVAYADLGTSIRTTSAICEGKIEDFINWRTDDARFTIYGTIHKRYGYAADAGPAVNPGGIYTQQPIPNPTPPWIGNGYYARTAMFFSQMLGTNVDQVDEAPGIIVVVLGTLVTVPDSAGDWVTTNTWSDNAAAHTRFLLTSDDYFKLSDAWINDESFYEAYQYNEGLIFDSSFSDLIFTPDTTSFSAGDKEKGRFLASTGHASAKFFEYLNGDATASETFLRTANVEPYTDAGAIPIEPPDPTDIPGGQTPNLAFFLRRRYTSNVVVSEQTRLADFLNDVLFPSSRLFISQDEQGRIKLKHKKPVDGCRATEEIAIAETAIDVDDVSAFIADTSRYLLIDPHTAAAEVKTIASATYSNATPTLTVDEYLSRTTFSGGNGSTVPQTATITATAPTAGQTATVTLDGTEFSFVASSADTEFTAAGFVFGTINAHPVLSRKFRATWTPGTAVVTITLIAGTITLDSGAENLHAAPLADPTAAPTGTGSSGGTFTAGDYRLVYTYVTERGETLISPVETVTLTANQKIDVSAITPPAGASAVRWYCSPSVDSFKLRLVKENNGAAFSITMLPALTATMPPDFNQTGCEMIRVQAVFSDRAETLSSAERSNVLKATYRWSLGGRDRAKNQIKLKFRDATQDFRLIELILNDDANIEKVKKVKSEEVNGQAIDSYHQAYRIAAGLLAEKLDASFFYAWQSDRAALLLEEGDVVAITDAGSGALNLPVRIEELEFDTDAGFARASFTARKYAQTLYDDRIRERQIPVVVETSDEFAPLYAGT